jgi:hypothetical protein
MSLRTSGLKDIGFKPNYETKAQKLMQLSIMLKDAQASKALASSSSSNISKKEEWVKTFLDSMIIVLMKMKKRIAEDLAKILFSFTTEDLSDFKIFLSEIFPKNSGFFPRFSRFQTTLKT